jgi:hypothetical protein
LEDIASVIPDRENEINFTYHEGENIDTVWNGNTSKQAAMGGCRESL